MVVFKLGDQQLDLPRRDSDEPRKEARLLIGVMVGRGGVEIVEDRARRSPRVGVAAMLGQMALQPVERRELPLDAAVAGRQHRRADR